MIFGNPIDSARKASRETREKNLFFALRHNPSLAITNDPTDAPTDAPTLSIIERAQSWHYPTFDLVKWPGDAGG